MELYLKSYSQSKFSQISVFKIKQKKKNVSKKNTSKTYSGFTPPLTPAWTGAGSLTVGPGGPLVRFDRSPPPPSSSGRMEAGLWRSTPAIGGSSRAPEGRDGSASLGQSSWWSRGWWGWRESPAASFEADGGFGRVGASRYGGSRASLRG